MKERCSLCSGELKFLGTLGDMIIMRCRDCHMEQPDHISNIHKYECCECGLPADTYNNQPPMLMCDRCHRDWESLMKEYNLG